MSMSEPGSHPEPPAPKKQSVFKKRIAKLPVWLWTVVVLLVLFIALGASGGGESGTSTNSAAEVAVDTQAGEVDNSQPAEEEEAEQAPPKKLTGEQAETIAMWNTEVSEEMMQFGTGMVKCGNLAELGGGIQEIADCSAEAYDGYEGKAYILIDELDKAANGLAPGRCKRSINAYKNKIAELSGTMQAANNALQQYDLEAFGVAAELYVVSAETVGKRANALVKNCV